MNVDLADLEINTSPMIKGRDVTFIYRGKAENVFLTGDYNQWQLRDKR